MSGFCKNWGFIGVLLQIFSRGCATNVALHKEAYYCNEIVPQNKLSDGIKTLTNFERFTEPCETVSFVNINLDRKYPVHYIIVFEGEGNDAGQLDFFTARLSDTICSEYPGRANLVDKSKGLRVNCANRNDVYSNVGIYSLKNIGFTITEIEVHTLGKNALETIIPIGCFSRFGTQGFEFELTACISFCKREQFALIGMKNNEFCGCSNKLDKGFELPITKCNVPCSARDLQDLCGGIREYSVFLIASVLPYYEGCVRTTQDFILSAVSRGNMTIAKCLRLCENRRYAYLQSGDYCMCQNSLSTTALLYEKVNCPTSCTGDAKMICGGDGMASVYSTCFSDMMFLQCSKFINCKDSYDMYGDCEGGCKPGYLGDRCIEKDLKVITTTTKVSTTSTTLPSTSTKPLTSTEPRPISTEPRPISSELFPTFIKPFTSTSTESFGHDTCLSVNPCLDQPNTVCVEMKLTGKTKCICVEGYARDDDDDDDGKECKDIDECKYEICDDSTSDCINLDGSYDCQCKEGFMKFTKDICMSNATSEDLYKSGDYLLILIPLIALISTILYFCSTEPTESVSTPSRQSGIDQRSLW